MASETNAALDIASKTVNTVHEHHPTREVKKTAEHAFNVQHAAQDIMDHAESKGKPASNLQAIEKTFDHVSK